MSGKLVIVESPSKSKTIEQYLGKDYKVLSSKGHIRDLAISGLVVLGWTLKMISNRNTACLKIKTPSSNL